MFLLLLRQRLLLLWLGKWDLLRLDLLRRDLLRRELLRQELLR